MSVSKSAEKTTRRPVQERAKRTMDSILTAATRVLSKEGIEGASTNKIADVAGVGIASLYQYFKNKDQIIHALVKKMIDLRLEVIRKNCEANPNRSLEQTVESVVQALIDAKVENARLERILEEQVPKVGAIKLLDTMDRQVILLLRDVLAPHRNEIKCEDLDESLFVIIQAVRGVLVGASFNRPEVLRSKRLLRSLTKMVMSELTL